jgi:hypothetical protein
MLRMREGPAERSAMGLIANIYKHKGQSFSAGGISETADQVTVVNVDGPFEPSPEAPAVMLVDGNLRGTVRIVPAMQVATWWVPMIGTAAPEGKAGPMYGGTVVGTSDSRFCDAVTKLTGVRDRVVDLHDRYETWADYDRMSR